MCLGYGNGCVLKNKKQTSLLKTYTNNDKINDMNVEEKAKFIGNGKCDCCVFRDIDCQEKTCKDGVKLWLESEAEI